MNYASCGLAVIFCGFISLLIGHETINIPENFSGVHGFTGKTVTLSFLFFHRKLKSFVWTLLITSCGTVNIDAV